MIRLQQGALLNLITVLLAIHPSRSVSTDRRGHDEIQSPPSSSSYLRRQLQYPEGRCIGWRKSCGGHGPCCRFINLVCGDQGQDDDPCRLRGGSTTSTSSQPSSSPSMSPIVTPSTIPSYDPSTIPSSQHK